ncbi:WD repeat-containing protein 20 isoform X1 [Bactrocera neohumeralis]|uniref:WD repeat-containing protein 20 isoform X1 n=1 Tax=Bactrocera neohumeralis TaxID=98809 RepID=UPI0021668AAD|nr:WD repeat-containing protein 20 isoform X1 [Bactrocera neohumeralis]
MAAQLDPNVKDDLKTQFVTREGTYRLLTLSEYSRPNRVGYNTNQSSPQVRVSIVSLPNNNPCPNTISGTSGGGSTAVAGSINGNVNGSATNNSKGSGDGSANGSNASATGSLVNGQQQAAYGVPATMDARLGAGISMHTMINGGSDGQNGLASQIYGGDRICFNFGRELYVYAFRGVKKGAEMTKPIDKKFYKGTNPSCHDFNATTATSTGAPLLVGFTTGQIQLVSPQPGPRELRKLYNEERLIDKTKVTCLKWLPNSPNLFLASHASGNLYLYNEDLPCTPTAPNYQPFKMGDGYTILTCKSKSTRNPLYKWIFNTENCCINEFCFSPCGSNLAIVSQDGFLRVFHYDTMELLGIARSYFGGFLCVCWSPDGKYIVVGGEDDLVTVWSLHERRVVARGQGHRSWVSVVAFDPYTTSYTNWDGGDFSDDENQMNEYGIGREARFSADSTANGFDYIPGVSSIAHEKNSTPNHTRQRPHSASFRSDASSSAALAPDKLAISYRLGSVSQDTQICLWDITEDVLRHPLSLRQRVNSVNLNDTSYMNGGIDADGIKVIRPIAIGNISAPFSPPQHTSSPTKETVAPENNSNSSSSKFSTANCTISSQSSNANTPPDEAMPAGSNTTGNSNSNIKANNTNNKVNATGNSIKFPNCISATKSDSIEGNNKDTASTVSTSGYNSKNSNSSTKSSDSSVSAFNSLTQRFSNFSFLSNSDKKTTSSITGSFDASQIAATHRTHRKGMSLLKSNNQTNNSNHNHQAYGAGSSATASGNDHNSGSGGGGIGNSSTTAHSFGSLKLGKSNTHSHSSSLSAASNAVVTSYDPMKLIGTPSCPRFDECPLLEPLICKKIAHERLSALIFREDCFLTACQDGFIYTWARPGYATQNVPQHLSPSQAAPPGGTVI